MLKINDIKIIPIIPAYNPDEKMVNYVKDLIKSGFKKIIVVDDGSKKDCEKYFHKISKNSECIILKHAINQGKGRALKTAFHYYLNELKNDYIGVVTADCDGQHSASDTLKVAISLQNNSKKLILGTRNFKSKDVPFRSKFGNSITTIVFKLLIGKKINDTQTGLRGIPNDFIAKCLQLNGEKYDYEINMLISAVRCNVDIKEEIIKTIYIDDNKSSHFNPISDSIKIYKVILTDFFKFTIAGILSFAIDILLFNLFFNILLGNYKYGILFSTILARIFSSLFNFLVNKNIVFDSKSNSKKCILKYYTLCIIQMLLSGVFTTLLANILNKNIAKIIVDLVLFFLSFRVQKKYVFK